jgi:phosphate-selective porin OprO and OprP
MALLWCAVLAFGMVGADDDESGRAPKPSDNEALRDLADRVLRLEERRQEPEKEKPKTAPSQPWDANKMLSFSSPDGNFTAKVGGRIYFVYRHIFDRQDRGGTSGAPDTFTIDSARVQLDGTFFKDFFYRLEGEGKSGETVNGVLSTGFFRTKDVYIGWQGMGDWLTLQGGQFKCPLSQEETTSSRFIDFAERSVLNRLVPGHVQGVLARGSLFDRSIEWSLGVMNGATNRDGDRGSVDTNDEKDCFGRFFFTPFKTMDLALVKQLRIGFDFTRGTRNRGATAVADVGSGDLGLPLLLDYTPGAAILEGVQSRWLGNFSWVYGPASIRAEYLRVNGQTRGAAENIFHQVAWYVSASFILTGEEKPLENRIKPKNNFSPLNGEWGAFELAARWAVIDGRNGIDAGLAPAGAQLKVTEYTFGLNWWWSPNVALRIDWERLTYDVDRTFGNLGAARRTADEIYVRWQIDF